MKKRLISMMLAIATAVSLTACSSVEANTSRTSSVESSSIAESTESTTSTTTDSKADSTTSATESVTTSESSEPAEDKYEIKITDEVYKGKAYVVEGIKTVIKDGKTYTFGGELDGGYIIDGVWLPDLKTEYPNADDLLCWDSLFEFFGLYKYINFEKIIETIPMSSDFYYDSNGDLWGPSCFDYYVGDPKNNKQDFCSNGNKILEESMAIIKDKKLDIKYDTNMTRADYQDEESKLTNADLVYDKIINEKLPVLAIFKNEKFEISTWKVAPSHMEENVEPDVRGANYGLAIGVYNDYFLVFVPSVEKFLAYQYEPGYNPICFAVSYSFK